MSDRLDVPEQIARIDRALARAATERARGVQPAPSRAAVPWQLIVTAALVFGAGAAFSWLLGG